MAGSSGEMFPTSSDGTYGVSNIKVEEDINMPEFEEVNVKTEKVIFSDEEECVEIKDEVGLYSEEEEEKEEDIDIKEEVS
jgi:hypothetical protein